MKDAPEIAIIGGGAAGLSAALYAARAGKRTLLLEKSAPGGQILPAPLVENYPGAERISGVALISVMQSQATQSGAEIRTAEVVSLERGEPGLVLRTEEGERIGANAVIVATGASPRRLELPGEKKLAGHGVSYCAYCDGNFYRGKTVAVVGGGNSALEWVRYLSDICGFVFLIHRREAFRGNPQVLEYLRTCSRVKLLCNRRVTALVGEERLTAVALESTDGSGQTERLAVDGVFPALGQVPDTGILKGLAPLDDRGYVIAGEGGELGGGLFAAGDCRAKAVRQLVTAASDGVCTAIGAVAFLNR